MANKAYKYRIYPDAKQKQLFAKTFGCVRFVKNHYLSKEEENHRAGAKYISRTANNNDCNRVLKEQYPWLREVDKFALTNGIYQLDAAYQNFFAKRGKYPRYKGKKDKQSYTTNYTIPIYRYVRTVSNFPNWEG